MDSATRRKNATRETTNTLKAWLYEHRKNPYPTKGEKIMLAIITKMTLTQVMSDNSMFKNYIFLMGLNLGSGLHLVCKRQTKAQKGKQNDVGAQE